MPYVGATVTNASAELLNTSAVMWLRDGDQMFGAVHRSSDPHGMLPRASSVPSALVRRAIDEAAVVNEAGRRAYPLDLTGTVTAVLEVATANVDGHLLGDQVLRQVATVLTATLRTADTAYRYGGEEIVVLLRETRLDDAYSATDRLRTAVTSLVVEGHPDLIVTASGGVSTRRTRMKHHNDMVAEADTALYESKRLGRNRVLATARRSETLVHGSPDGLLLPEQVIPS